MLPFRPMTWEDRENYTDHYRRCPVHYAEYSFFGLWGWNETVPIDLAWEDGLCWVRSRGPLPGICAPVGSWETIPWDEVLSKHFLPGDTLFDVPEDLIACFPQNLLRRLSIEEDRDQWEYVHSVQELISLKGSKYAHKRNRVRAFLSSYEYDWEYLPMLPEDFPAVLEFQEKWRARREAEDNDAAETASLYDEDHAVRTALERWEDFPFLGGVLKVEGEIIGYTIAEELDAQTLDIRFEKAVNSYHGSYQALNQLFLQNQGSGYAWVNREEDMGEPGLRAAKLSYNPVRMLKKYRVRLTG